MMKIMRLSGVMTLSSSNPMHDGAMRAMLLEVPLAPLRLSRIPIPFPSDYEVLIRINACGVCRTDLHIADSELPPHKSPLIIVAIPIDSFQIELPALKTKMPFSFH